MTNSLKNKTEEQLKATYKGLLIIVIAIVAVSLAVMGFSIFAMLTKDDNATSIPLFVVGISCFAMVPIQMISMQKIKSELKSRQAAA